MSKLKGRTDPENDYERERENLKILLGWKCWGKEIAAFRSLRDGKRSQREREISNFREQESASETVCVFEGESDFACFKG